MTNRLYRSRSDRLIGGVCGGLGTYFGLDPVIVRLLFVALAIWGGFGVLGYLILWIVIPPEERRGAATQDVIHDNVSEIEQQAHEFAQDARGMFSGGAGSSNVPKERTLWAAVILIVVGAVFLVGNVFGIPLDRILFPVMIIGLGAYLLFQAAVRR
jgi:phage shock protein C